MQVAVKLYRRTYFLECLPTIGIDLLQYRAAGLTADSPAYIYELFKDGFVA